MIVEPVPTGPSGTASRPRRAAARAAIALPVVLLVLVAGLGIVGQPVTGASPGSSTAAVTASPRASLTPDGTPVPGDTVAAAPGRPAVPPVVDGLEVQAITDVLDARAAGRTMGVVAVAGWLGILAPPADCHDPDLGPLGALCERIGLLAQRPWSPAGSDASATLGPHLHVRAAMGVQLPPAIARTTIAAGGSPLSAVVIGHFDPLPAAGCSPAGIRCDEGFELDAVAWAEGVPFRPGPVIDLGLDATPADWLLSQRPLAEAALGPGITVLGSALLHPETLADIDARIAIAVAASGRPRGLVWYVRGLETGHDTTDDLTRAVPPRVDWAVVDDLTGRVIASGVESGRRPG
jgi:hypothetical protein